VRGRHAGAAQDQGLLDQVQACQGEISAFLVARASAPASWDSGVALRDALEALARVYPILQRASSTLLQVEIEATHDGR
jgi:hypothetical protein